MKKHLICAVLLASGCAVSADVVSEEAVQAVVVAAAEAKEPEIVALLKQKIAEATTEEERAHYEAQLQSYYAGVYDQVIQEFTALHAAVEAE